MGINKTENLQEATAVGDFSATESPDNTDVFGTVSEPVTMYTNKIY